MDAGSVFTFLASASTIASLLISADLKVTVRNVREFLSRVPREFREDLSSEEGIELINLMVIDPDLLGDLTGEVQKSERDYRRCLRKGKTPQERDRCDRRAERAICEALNRIRDRNDNDIPTEFLKKRWESYRCVPY